MTISINLIAAELSTFRAPLIALLVSLCGRVALRSVLPDAAVALG